MLFSAVKICEDDDRQQQQQQHDDVITQTPSTEGLSSPFQALLMSSDSPSSTISLPPPSSILTSSSSSSIPISQPPTMTSLANMTSSTVSAANAAAPAISAKCPEDERTDFLEKLSNYMTETGQNFAYIPIFDHKELDLWRLYKCVTARGGLQKVVDNKKWQEVIRDLGINKGRTDASYRLKTHYEKCLLPYEKAFFKSQVTSSPPSDDNAATSSSYQNAHEIMTSSLAMAAAAAAAVVVNGLPQITVSEDGGGNNLNSNDNLNNNNDNLNNSIVSNGNNLLSNDVSFVGSGSNKRKRVHEGKGGCEEGGLDDKRMCRELLRVWDDESLARYVECFGLEVGEVGRDARAVAAAGGDEMMAAVFDHFVNQKIDEEFVINQFLDSFNKN